MQSHSSATTLRVLLAVLDGTCTFADVQVRKAEASVRASKMPKTVVYERYQSGAGELPGEAFNELRERASAATR